MDSKNMNQKPKKQKALVGLVAIIFLALFFLGASYKTVNIYVEDQHYEVSTTSSEPKKILEDAKIPVEPDDRIEWDGTGNVKNGESIYVYPAMNIKVNDGGEIYAARTTYRKVEEVLEELGIRLGKLDKVAPHRLLPLFEGDTLRITRIEEIPHMETQKLSYEEEIIFVEDLEPGERRVVQEGVEGIKLKVEMVTYENGEEILRVPEKQEIIREPQKKIVEEGEALSFKTPDGSRYEYQEAIVMEATAYTAGYESTGKNPGDSGYGITRSGTRVRPGVVAVDPSVIPLGTRLYVESLDGSRSYGFARAEDTGSAIVGNKIDLYYENVDVALRFGRRNVKVYILE